MKELTPLLESLATKLGTTVDMLWGVLLKQAPISAAVDLSLCVALILLLAYVFRFVQRKTTPYKTEENRYREAEWEDEGACLAWMAFVAFALIVVLAVVCSAQGIVSGFFNPEYWALEHIMGKVK